MQIKLQFTFCIGLVPRLESVGVVGEGWIGATGGGGSGARCGGDRVSIILYQCMS